MVDGLNRKKKDVEICCEQLEKFKKLVNASNSSVPCGIYLDDVDRKVLQIFKDSVVALLNDAYSDDAYFSDANRQLRLEQKLQAYIYDTDEDIDDVLDIDSAYEAIYDEKYLEDRSEMGSVSKAPSDKAKTMMYQLFVSEVTKDLSNDQQMKILNELRQVGTDLAKEYESLSGVIIAARMKVRQLSTECQKEIYKADDTVNAVYEMLRQCREEAIFAVDLEPIRQDIIKNNPQLSQASSASHYTGDQQELAFGSSVQDRRTGCFCTRPRQEDRLIVRTQWSISVHNETALLISHGNADPVGLPTECSNAKHCPAA
uniref:ING domain-containing protein n=1 Tax=Steinernema glaseri TaxID=37863 RepID=A0A1I7ZTB5_9BILA